MSWQPPVRDESSHSQQNSQSDLLEAARYASLIFIYTRIIMGLLAVLALGLVPPRVTPDGYNFLRDYSGNLLPSGWSTLWTAWERWDAHHYLAIADRWYGPPGQDPSPGFFPLYPIAIRLARPLTGGSVLGAGLLVANVAFLLALVLFYRLTVAEHDRHTARRSLLYLAINPVAFFFLAPFTESLFLLLALVVFWSARRQRWLLAGVAGALASATRFPGVLLALPIALEALRFARLPTRGAKHTLVLGLGSTALVPAGLVAVLGYWWVQRDSFLLPFDLQRSDWHHRPEWPWVTLVQGARQGLTGIGQFAHGFNQVDLLYAAFTLVLVPIVIRRMPASYASWTVLSLLLPLSTPVVDPAYERVLVSTPRYTLVLFPLTWALVYLADRTSSHTALVAVSSGLLALLTASFVNFYSIY